jgi:hypothetical protein
MMVRTEGDEKKSNENSNSPSNSPNTTVGGEPTRHVRNYYPNLEHGIMPSTTNFINFYFRSVPVFPGNPNDFCQPYPLRGTKMTQSYTKFLGFKGYVVKLGVAGLILALRISNRRESMGNYFKCDASMIGVSDALELTHFRGSLGIVGVHHWPTKRNRVMMTTPQEDTRQFFSLIHP